MKKVYSHSYKQAIGLDDPNYNWHEDLDKANKQYSDKMGPGEERTIPMMHNVGNWVCVAILMPEDYGSQYAKVAQDLCNQLLENGIECKLMNNKKSGAIGVFIQRQDFSSFIAFTKTSWN